MYGARGHGNLECITFDLTSQITGAYLAVQLGAFCCSGVPDLAISSVGTRALPVTEKVNRPSSACSRAAVLQLGFYIL